jgi:hypothetical protein
MAIVVVMAALVGAGVWGAILLEGHLAAPARPATPRPRHRGHPVPCQRRRPPGPGRTPPLPNARCRFGHHPAPPAARAPAGRAGRLWASRRMAARRGPRWRDYLLTAAVLLAFMRGGTLPVPL